MLRGVVLSVRRVQTLEAVVLAADHLGQVNECPHLDVVLEVRIGISLTMDVQQ